MGALRVLHGTLYESEPIVELLRCLSLRGMEGVPGFGCIVRCQYATRKCLSRLRTLGMCGKEALMTAPFESGVLRLVLQLANL